MKTRTERWMGLGLLVLVLLTVLLGQGGGTVQAQGQPTAAYRMYLPLVQTEMAYEWPLSPPRPITLTEGEAHILAAVNAARVAAGCPAATHDFNLSHTMRFIGEQTGINGMFIEASAEILLHYGYPWGMVLQSYRVGGTAEEAVASWLATDADAAKLLDCFEHRAPAPMYAPQTRYAIGVGEVGGVWVVGVGAMTPIPLISMSYRDQELRAMTLVNAARVRAGCPVARISTTLTTAARDWADWMRSPEGSYRHATYGWYQSYGYYYGALENIAGGTTGDGAVEAWMDSPPHRRNMLWCDDPTDLAYSPDTTYDLGIGTHEGSAWVLALTDVRPGVATPP